MNLPLITGMVSVLGIWAKLCNIAFQFHSLLSFLPPFLRSFLSMIFLMHVYFFFDAFLFIS